MRAKLVQIGNSRGIRLPKHLLERTGINGEVELEAEKDSIVIRASTGARKGWEKAFQAMAAHGDDDFLEGPVSSEWDETEWEWK